ncbi:MAG: tetratricopeptide repeat protein [Patescibacteria group bacterium]|jgi:tetratricopeptide (TPR) repeat protein
MLIDWIALAIFGLCMVICAVIIWRKLPTLASIKTEAIPKHQQAAQKKALLDKRLQDKLGSFETAVIKVFKLIYLNLQKFFRNLLKYLKVRESEYRRKVITQKAIENPDALRAKIVTALNEAQINLKQNDLEKAEQIFVDVISMDAKNIDAYLGLSDVAMSKKDYANAKEALNFVLKLHQDNEAAYSRLGRIASDEGNFNEAEADYLKSISLNASMANAQFELGSVEEKLGNYEKAEQAFSESVKLEPANPKYLDGLIQFAIRQKNKNLAKETLKKLKEANPENEKIDELSENIKTI